MKFGSIEFIYLIWLVPVLIVFYVYVAKQKQKVLQLFAKAEMFEKLIPKFSKFKQHLKQIMIVLALCFIIVAFLRPQWGYHLEDVKRRGVDIFIALDVSKSMLAEDIKPNRLERAKLEIKDLIKILKGDRIGIIPFSGTSFVSCPLTLDYSTARLFLDDIDVGTIPTGGTNVGNAISKALKSFEGKDKNYKVLLVISDGEDHAETVLTAAQDAKNQGVKIYTIGIGSFEGAPISVVDKNGSKSFIKDRSGKIVLSKLNETVLQKIALVTGGAYLRAAYGDLNLEQLYDKKIAILKKKELHSAKRKRYDERFQYFLVAALILLIAELCITEKVSRKK